MAEPVEEGAPEPAEALAAVVAKLRAELAGVRTAMRNRAVIEQAKGVLVERLGIGPDEGFDHLVRLSQRTNIKLIEVAAAIVGTTAPDPVASDVIELIDDEMREHVARTRRQRQPARPERQNRPVGPAPRPARQPKLEALQAQHQLLSARIASARTFDEVAQVLREGSESWPVPAVTVITLLEPDGSLHLAGSAGLSESARSQWTRIPPFVEVPLVRAVRDGEPLLLADHAAIRRHFPAIAEMPFTGEAAFSAPLMIEQPAGRRVVGAFGMSWSSPLSATDDVRRYLAALAGPVSRKVEELSVSPEGFPGLEPWFAIVLGTIHNPGALLAPIREQGRINDFRIEYVNDLARAVLGPERIDPADATLLSVYPDIGSRVLLPEFVRVLTTGEPVHLDSVPIGDESAVMTVRASRLWDRVFAIWKVRSESEVLHDQLLEAERIARIGSFSWDLRTGQRSSSPQLNRLLYGDDSATRAPISAEELAACVHDDDLLAVQEAIRRTVVHGKQLGIEFRGADRLAGKRLRVTAEPRVDTDGSVTMIRGTVQDVTEERALEARLRLAEEALAAQRRRVEAELRAGQTLQQALLPTEPELGTTQGLVVRGRCRVSERTGRVEGDWYDAYPLPNGATVLVVGDVAGEGLDSMTAAARLRYAVRAYAALDLGPAQILAAVNAMLCTMEPERTATMTVARFEPDGRQLRWAGAGKAAPVRYRRNGRAAVLDGALGLPVGASTQARYRDSATALASGDRLLLYTDGLVGERGAELVAAIDILLAAANRSDMENVDAVVNHIVRSLHSAPNEDMCGLLVRVTR
jgi:serine phosphatase RsbU (regulator of sigma subunit)